MSVSYSTKKVENEKTSASHGKKMKKKFFRKALKPRHLQTKFLLNKKKSRLFVKFCHNVVMKIEKDLSHIAKAVALANANGNAVPSQFAGLVDELKQEALAEKLVVEHGVLNASDEDIKEEFVSLDAVERSEEVEDFDNDENLVDMDSVSGSMREIFGE